MVMITTGRSTANREMGESLGLGLSLTAILGAVQLVLLEDGLNTEEQ